MPADKSIRVSVPGASGHHRMQDISGPSVDGRSTDNTYLPESVLAGGRELASSLSSKVNNSWATAASSAPPFGAEPCGGSERVAGCRSGGRRNVDGCDRQRTAMVDGSGDYEISGKSYEAGIATEPVSGMFGDDGSGASTVRIKVADSVRDGYYPLVLTAKAGKGSGRSCVGVGW